MTTTQHTSRRRLVAATLLVTAGASAAAMVGPQATAFAAPADQYVAVSYSPVDEAAGLSIDSNLDVAIRGSLSKCGIKAGHCVNLAWSKNGCVALAVNGDYYYYGWHGASYAEAQNGALQRAGGGTIMMSQCITR